MMITIAKTIIPTLIFFFISVNIWFSQKARICQSRNLKIQNSKISQTAQPCRTLKFSQPGKQEVLKFCLKPKLFQGANKLTANVGSYTRVRTAGDFLSSRKEARAERCPAKTTAAALDG